MYTLDPETKEFMAEGYEFACAVAMIPAKPKAETIAETVSIGKHEADADSLYDLMYADLFGDKAKRMAKYHRTHGKDKTPADRKRDKQNRMHRMYGEEVQWMKFRFQSDDPQYCRGGWGWYGNPEGKKNPINPEMDVIRNRKYADRERILREDFKVEIAMHEERMAEYRDHMYWYDRFTSDAENMLDEEIDGKWTTPEKVMDAINGFRMLAEDEKKYAQEILKGEMYK